VSAAACAGDVRVSRTLIRQRWFAPLMVGVVGVIGSGIGYWNPSLWNDETATLSVSTRSVGQILALARHRDAVHTAYYLFMHVWTGALGIAPWALRLPSVLAVGVAAAGVVVLGRQVGTTPLGVTAGLLFAFLPRVTWAATEARSFAMVAMLAVWLTVVLLCAVRGAAAWWIGYAALAAIAVTLFIFLALVVLAHALSLTAWWARTRRRSQAVTRWAIASGTAALLTLPFVFVAVGQSGQITHYTFGLSSLVREVGIVQWFLGAFPERTRFLSFHPLHSWAVGGAALALSYVVLICLGLLRRDDPDTAAAGPTFVELAAPWLVVPTLATVAFSLVGTTLYWPRYMIVSAPVVALLAAAGVLSLRRRRLTVIAVASILLFTAPVFLEQRSGTAKVGSDWKYAAACIGDRARPGDVVVFGKLARKLDQTTRKIAIAYPGNFVGLRDIAAGRSALDGPSLWPGDRPLAEVIGDLRDARRVWLVSDGAPELRWEQRREQDLRTLAAAGYHPTWIWRGTVTWIYELRSDRPVAMKSPQP
jgi:mannosyltransferase